MSRVPSPPPTRQLLLSPKGLRVWAPAEFDTLTGPKVNGYPSTSQQLRGRNRHAGNVSNGNPVHHGRVNGDREHRGREFRRYCGADNRSTVANNRPPLRCCSRLLYRCQPRLRSSNDFDTDAAAANRRRSTVRGRSHASALAPTRPKCCRWRLRNSGYRT